jgi:hypothetical protein
MKKEIYMYTNNDDFQMKLRNTTARNVLSDEDLREIRSTTSYSFTSIYNCNNRFVRKI